jgi:hypothetical protein
MVRAESLPQRGAGRDEFRIVARLPLVNGLYSSCERPAILSPISGQRFCHPHHHGDEGGNRELRGDGTSSVGSCPPAQIQDCSLLGVATTPHDGRPAGELRRFDAPEAAWRASSSHSLPVEAKSPRIRAFERRCARDVCSPRKPTRRGRLVGQAPGAPRRRPISAPGPDRPHAGRRPGPRTRRSGRTSRPSRRAH